MNMKTSFSENPYEIEVPSVGLITDPLAQIGLLDKKMQNVHL